jgi:hypothetical protein
MQSCLKLSKITVPTQDQVIQYIHWCHNEKNLKFATINSYISSLCTLFKLKDQNVAVFSSFKTKIALRAVRNLDEVKSKCQNSRKVFSFELLQILGHFIAISSWTENSKQVFWTAACVLFFGSFRISEILSKFENSYDPLTVLLWSDVKFLENSVRIFVKSPKIFKQGGISVDLFRIKNSSVCPVHLLTCLKQNSTTAKFDSPVFMFENSKLLTPAAFNKTLRILLQPVFGIEAQFFSSHSFRAAIPAALADNPNIASKESVMGWGRWDSNAYEKYTRLKFHKRKETFENICSLFKL